MKKLIITLLLISNYFLLSSQTIIEKSAKSLAEKTIETLKKNKVADDLKIAVLNFGYNNSYSDSIRTDLGVDFSNALEQQLQVVIQNNKLNYTVLTTNSDAQDKMNGLWVIPEGTDEAEYWKNFLDNQTPDYYISGNLKINDDYSQLTTSNVKIVADNFDLALKDFVVQDFTNEISLASDKKLLLQYQTAENISDISDYIALQLMFQNNIKNIKLTNFTFENSELPSAFSYKLNSELEQSLVNKSNYTVEKNVTRGFKNKTDETVYTLSGTYWLEGDNIKINTVLQNSETNKITSSVNCYLPVNYLTTNNIAYKTESIERVEEMQTIFETNKIENEFDVNLWTNHGNENIIFEEGETMRITVIASKPCYLRLIDIMSDGTSVLLLDNYQITEENTNKEYTLPQKFVCSAPFGVETLVLNAQTELFADINYKKTGDYKIIVDDLTTVVNKNRGFVLETEKAEKIIHVTTIE